MLFRLVSIFIFCVLILYFYRGRDLLGIFYKSNNSFLNSKITDIEDKVQIISYYRKDNLRKPITKKEALQALEYYRVFLDKKSGLPIREEHYQEYSLKKYKLFYYNNKNQKKIFANTPIKGC